MTRPLHFPLGLPSTAVTLTSATLNEVLRFAYPRNDARVLIRASAPSVHSWSARTIEWARIVFGETVMRTAPDLDALVREEMHAWETLAHASFSPRDRHVFERLSAWVDAPAPVRLEVA